MIDPARMRAALRCPKVPWTRLLVSLGIVVVAACGSVMAVTFDVTASKSIYGGGTVHATFDVSNGLLGSFQVPTSLGDVGGTVTYPTSELVLVLTLSGTTQSFSTTAFDLGGGVVRVTTQYSPGNTLTYDISDSGATLVQSTIQDCATIQGMDLYKAMLEVEATLDGLSLNYRAVEQQRAYFGAARALATLVNAGLSVITNCATITPRAGAYACDRDSTNYNDCRDCCDK